MDKVFKALTDTEATGKFWFGNAATSEWKVGSPVAFHREGKLILKGEVLEYDPPRRLSYTFKPMHDELYSGEQPSPATLLPSSHCSPASFTPSPQMIRVQSLRQASSSIALPSSHCSPRAA